MTQPTWAALAATALDRLQHLAAENDIGSRSDRLDWSDHEAGDVSNRSRSITRATA
ncbi:hypothetical protein [Paracoccus endophyticus]|uniref:hypothetical protein n=1 Tax=Paracoccus endophyticus TaxID=2233774 RepID=UPI0013A6DDC0|nr:hypothetical protein [Paracoccus endophyticus]